MHLDAELSYFHKHLLPVCAEQVNIARLCRYKCKLYFVEENTFQVHKNFILATINFNTYSISLLAVEASSCLNNQSVLNIPSVTVTTAINVPEISTANIFMVDRRYRWVSPMSTLRLIVSGHASVGSLDPEPHNFRRNGTSRDYRKPRVLLIWAFREIYYFGCPCLPL